MPTRVRSHAKINLGLYIGAPRPDGFHQLATVYQTLEMHDFVTVSAHPAAATAIELTSNDSRVPKDARNTAWKMVELALAALEITAEVEIHIEKHLPVQGGLGAGSANAVAALVGLERELGPYLRLVKKVRRSVTALMRRENEPNALPIEARFPYFPEGWAGKRLEIAAQVGSDVPLFLIGGTSLGLDRGQQVYPLPDIEPVSCVVAAPAIGVSTPQAFCDWDTLCAAEGLTAETSAGKLNELSRAYASAFASGSSGVLSSYEVNSRKDLAGPEESALVRTGILSWIQNDFERVVLPQHPPLREIKRLLSAPGTPEAALHASLSGSGSALFGLYQARESAEAAVDRLARFQEVPVRATLTRTLDRASYWGQMLQ